MPGLWPPTTFVRFVRTIASSSRTALVQTDAGVTYLKAAAPDGKFILKAIDHGHIFTCGRPLSSRLTDIDNVQDDRIYGLFPSFQGHLTLEPMEAVLDFFRDVRSHLWDDLLTLIPDEWQVSNDTKHAIDQFLLNRARYLADHFREMLMREMPQGILDFDIVGDEENER